MLANVNDENRVCRAVAIYQRGEVTNVRLLARSQHVIAQTYSRIWILQVRKYLCLHFFFCHLLGKDLFKSIALLFLDQVMQLIEG